MSVRRVAFIACLQDEAWKFPEALPMALAAQAYAKSELLWYFRHVGEQLPASPAASGAPVASKLVLPLLAGQPTGLQITEDGHVITLVAAATAMYDFLVSRHHIMSCHVGHDWLVTPSMHRTS